MRRGRRPSWLAMTCMGLAVALAVVLWLQQRGPDCRKREEQVRTLVHSAGGSRLRGAAVADLAACSTLRGLRRRDVRRALGPPDPEESERTLWIYSGEVDYVGDASYLYVAFDARGRVTSADYDG